MKKIIYLAVPVLAALCMSSCRSEENEVLALRLNETSIELVKGETFQLEATIVPASEDARITWTSEDESYVTVDENGLVTAVALNKNESDDIDDENTQAISIFAQYKGGAAECEVTVLPLEPESISLSPEQVALNYGEQILLTVSYEPEDVDIKDVEWSTTDAFVATVKDGVVTTKGYGSCEIVAKCRRLEARTFIFVKQ